MQDEVLARLTPTPARRGFALIMLYGLGALLLYLGLTSPPEGLVWQLFLYGTAIGALVLGEVLRRATAVSLELTETELRDSTGRRLCLVADIKGVDRGAFAFKPSNGFLIRLSVAGPRAWQPGLWWRLGKRIGVGGVTPGPQAKFMADMITAKITLRDGG